MRRPRSGQEFFRPLRQVIESVNATFKTQLGIEHHRGKTIDGVCTRIAQRVLALTAAIWHNDNLGLGRPTLTDRLRPLRGGSGGHTSGDAAATRARRAARPSGSSAARRASTSRAVMRTAVVLDRQVDDLQGLHGPRAASSTQRGRHPGRRRSGGAGAAGSSAGRPPRAASAPRRGRRARPPPRGSAERRARSGLAHVGQLAALGAHDRPRARPLPPGAAPARAARSPRRRGPRPPRRRRGPRC